MEEGSIILPDIFLTEDDACVDPEWSPLKEQVSENLQEQKFRD